MAKTFTVLISGNNIATFDSFTTSYPASANWQTVMTLNNITVLPDNYYFLVSNNSGGDTISHSDIFSVYTATVSDGTYVIGEKILEGLVNTGWQEVGIDAGHLILGLTNGDKFVIDLDGFEINSTGITNTNSTTGRPSYSTIEYRAIDSSGTMSSTTLENADQSETAPLCYLKGTKILTPNGMTAIEDLSIGDFVVSEFGGMRKIKWIGRQTFVGAFSLENEAVHFAPGSLNDNCPSSDLYVSQGHSMRVGEILVFAKDLINGITIKMAKKREKWEYYQIDLGYHDLILANGAWSETFGDCRDIRNQFDNYHEFLKNNPDHIAPSEPELCLARPVASKLYSDVVQKIAARAIDMHPKKKTTKPLEGEIVTVSRPCNISGWVRDLEYPGVSVEIEVCLDGVVLGTSVASVIMPGSNDNPKLRFDFSGSEVLSSNELLRVTIRRKSEKRELASLIRSFSGETHGNIDLIHQNGIIEGWVRDLILPTTPIMVEVLLEDEVIGVTRACQYRQDLAKVGFGDVAFSFNACRDFTLNELKNITIRRMSNGDIIRAGSNTRLVKKTSDLEEKNAA